MLHVEQARKNNSRHKQTLTKEQAEHWESKTTRSFKNLHPRFMWLILERSEGCEKHCSEFFATVKIRKGAVFHNLVCLCSSLVFHDRGRGHRKSGEWELGRPCNVTAGPHGHGGPPMEGRGEEHFGYWACINRSCTSAEFSRWRDPTVSTASHVRGSLG